MPNPRKFLFPFSLIYDGVTRLRNKLYDWQWLRSTSFELPVIAVGNLNMGGTGKSPMIEYLIKILSKKNKVATLSRGYKRQSKGFQLVEVTDPASKAGDEPLQFKNKFPEAIVAVDANRREGISRLLNFSPDIILLDDAFQHRKVKAGMYILLTAYGDLYSNDLILPAGNLRESVHGAARADIIIVTKCPAGLKKSEMKEIKENLSPGTGQEVFFTSIRYSDKIYSANGEKHLSGITREFTLVTGIANPAPLKQFLASENIELKHLNFPDHHNFTEKELLQLKAEKMILTTEKDYMRLRDEISSEYLYYLPIEIAFLNSGEEKFRKKIADFTEKK